MADQSTTVVMDEAAMWLFTNRVDLDRITNLEDVESQSDPEDNMYKSHYEAREISTRLMTDLRSRLDELPDSGLLRIKCLSILCALRVRQGVNFIETEERTDGEKLLLSVVSDLESIPAITGLIRRVTQNWLNDMGDTNQDDPTSCLDHGLLVCGVLRHAYTGLGSLYSDRSQSDEAMIYLRRGKRLYAEWNALSKGKVWPETGYSLLGMASDKEKCFEAGYTVTLFNLAQVYSKSSEPADKSRSAKYCHRTLLRQLDSMEYQPLEWSLNCATLSQYYVGEARFQTAQHCLCASDRILSEAKETEDDEDKIVQARADMLRCWVKYGLALLDVSWARLGDDDIITTAGKEKQACLEPDFDKFNIDLSSSENKIRWQWTVTFDEAREVFLFIQERIKEAKVFYSIDSRCSDYIQLVQDQSKAFRFISNFDTSLERQCCMHKRRVDMLIELEECLNKQHYVMVCRQLTFEIAQTYSDMLDLKMTLLQMSSSDSSSQSNRAHAGKKINSLAQDSIRFYTAFLNHHRRPDGSMPDSVGKDEVRSVLVAYFCIGRLFKKLLTSDPKAKIRNIQMATEKFQFVVDYCESNPEVEFLVREEVAVCHEMIQLMPVSIAEIESKLIN